MSLYATKRTVYRPEARNITRSLPQSMIGEEFSVAVGGAAALGEGSLFGIWEDERMCCPSDMCIDSIYRWKEYMIQAYSFVFCAGEVNQSDKQRVS